MLLLNDFQTLHERTNGDEKDYKDALINYEKAIHIKPNESTFYFHKAITYIRIQKYNEAIKCKIYFFNIQSREL